MDDELSDRARSFFDSNALSPIEQLGFGIHGRVWLATKKDGSMLAIKVFERLSDYRRELEVYLRLDEEGVNQICGCDVPVLICQDDAQLVIGMSVVEPPYVLDFAGSQLDRPMDFPPEVMAEWLAENEAEFGEDEWPKVLEILWELEGLGIYLTDINPRNISPPGGATHLSTTARSDASP